MEITFPGGMAVEAHFKQFSVLTDQPLAYGGQDSAPAPFDLFLVSLATCAGYYALRFCQERGLSTEGLKLSLETEKDTERHRLKKLRIAIRLPADFPEKYHQAIIRATGQCSVKLVITDPPEIEVIAI